MKPKTISFGFGKNLIALAVLMTGMASFITISGCNSYDRSCKPDSVRPVYLDNPAARGNPFLVFDHPSAWPGCRSTNSESILRWDWPVAQTPGGYITGREIMVYEERTADDQYISSDNVPRQHYHRRVYGYRTGIQYR